MDVILHIGAHRTGTTTLQRFLNANRAALKGQGIAFWGPGKTRGGLFTGLIKAPNRVTPEEDRLAQRARGLISIEIARLEARGIHTLIVSEENMNGGLVYGALTQRLYPQAKARLSRIADAFAPHPMRVALGIRSYDRHWASVLSFCLKQGHPMLEPEEMRAIATQPRRWTTLIRETAEVFPKAELVVWPFEALIGLPELQLGALLGQAPETSFQAKREWYNSSPSVQDLRGLLRDQGASDDTIAQLGAGLGRWQPFTEAETALMRAAYAQDLAWLRAGADGLATYVEGPEDIPGATRPGRGKHHDERQTGMG